MSNLWIGTSGWTYVGWRHSFYPEEVTKKKWLGWYAEHFSTTEINGSFYCTPSLEAVGAWRNQTPEGFRKARASVLIPRSFPSFSESN
jgi:uncharacterized protein YecE (DUF72 family)